MNKKIISAVLGTVLAGTMMLPAPAAAQSLRSQERFVSERCLQHPNWRGCRDWRENRHRWGRNDYRQWYRWNQRNVGSSIAAGIFGFAIGAAIAGSAARSGGSSWDNHVARCEARYRSYNPRTDMFLGYDGQYHRCNL